ncbi:hypothetical protein CERSUDRAFT_112397 [Gelatoporia subvermispora B]|uniref:Peroxin/Ferlin domain-containing protein n=1 Tax=Ceriporiopsis subvermispora (strain B) TaxID=914234 RepID=M2PTY4_CERS8|nr:hypothetical protein CERSUDRAFT_112397 [Gelatoporia subvermispora B]
MATLDYVDIPSCATRLQTNVPIEDIRPTPKIVTPLPRPERSHTRSASLPTNLTPTSPTKVAFNLPQVLLSSALQLPANAPATPRDAGKGITRLLTTRDPLSIPITTVNFRRFVSKSGPAFWLQDRIEEIVMWRKGQKHTAVWMAVYAFICYFPRTVLLLPHVVLLGILLGTHPARRRQLAPDEPTCATTKPINPPPPQGQLTEGSVDWLANVQAIQNLMGAVSDAHDFVLPIAPHLTHASPYTPVILTFTLATFFLALPLINILPMRTTFLILGLSPLLLTHPFTRFTLIPTLLSANYFLLRRMRTRMYRLIDNDKLEDKHWRTEMREVELFENERWLASAAGEEGVTADAGWSRINLRPGERRAWTRGRDGWSGVLDDGSGDVSSNLTFSLAPGWLFVETEDWRPDVEGTWIDPGKADDCGWVYTNDAWQDPQASPLEDWRKTGTMTRRRRWIRRIYYDSTAHV